VKTVVLEESPDVLENSIPDTDWASIWLLVKRHRWHFGLPLFIVWAILWVVGWFLPAVFRSGTLILVQPQRIPQQYVVPNVATDIQDQLQSMTQQILSRTRLLRIVDEFNLYPMERQATSPEDVLERMRKDIEIELVPNANRRSDELSAFRIYYRSRDPRTAQMVTSQLASLFIEENLRTRQEQAETTTEFLEAQLAAARTRLTEQEQRVRDFKTSHLGQLPAELQSNIQVLSGLQTQLQAEVDALDRAEQQRLYLQSVISQYRAVQGELPLAPGRPNPLDEELVKEKTELARISAQHTDNHPDVVKLKAQIAKTEQLKRDLASNVTSTADFSSPVQTQPGLVEIESQLKANQLELENRKRGVRDLKSQIATYQSRLSATPIREQEMAGLTRDYEQSKADYESLLAKKNQSELATNLEKRQQGQQFQVLDPPDLPVKPYSPNRLKINLIGLVAGVLLGFAISMVLEIRDDRLHGEADLRKIVPGGAVIEIPPLPTTDERSGWRKRNVLEWMAATFMTIALCLGSMMTYLRR
jgi:polysaccharide chain length determinant protein (PEP-CTERM system associated)